MNKKIVIPAVFFGVIIILIIVAFATGFVSVTKPVDKVTEPMSTIVPTDNPNENIILPDGTVITPDFVFLPETPTPTIEPTPTPVKRQDTFDEECINVKPEKPVPVSSLNYNNIALSDYINYGNYRVHYCRTENVIDFAKLSSSCEWTGKDGETIRCTLLDDDELSYRKRILENNGFNRYLELSTTNPLGKDSSYEIGKGLLNWESKYPEEDSDPTMSGCQLLTDFVLKTKYGNTSIMTLGMNGYYFGYAYLQIAPGALLVCNVQSTSETYLIAYMEEILNKGILIAELEVE